MSPTQAPQPTVAPQPTAPPKPAPTDPPKPSGVGQVGARQEAGGIALTVEKVSKIDQAGQFARAKPGNTYLVADVVLENPGRDEAPYNPLYFKVKDGTGQEYTASLIGPDNSLKSGNLAKGDKVRGAVSFEVPTAAKGFVLSYEPIVILGGYRPIRIDLGV